MTKEEAINKLAHIIFDAAKGGSIPFNVDGKYCAMSVARAKINEFLSPYSDTTELLMLNLDEAAEVDLEKELDKYTANNFWALEGNNESPYLLKDDMLKVAKHFYELGLKAKGE